MDSLIPNGFLSALTEVSARMAEIATEGRGVGSSRSMPSPMRRSIASRSSTCAASSAPWSVRSAPSQQSRPPVAVDGKGMADRAAERGQQRSSHSACSFEQTFNDGLLVVDGLDLPVRVGVRAAMSPDHGKGRFPPAAVGTHRWSGRRARADGGSLLFEASMERSAPNVAPLERDLRTAFSGAGARALAAAWSTSPARSAAAPRPCCAGATARANSMPPRS